jgi:hypothetical protein
MKRISLTCCLATLFVVALPGGSLVAGPSVPEFKKIDNPHDIPGLVEKVKGRLETDFVLDHFPENTRTLEEGFTYLATASRAIIRNAVMKGETVYGTEFTLERGMEKFRLFVFSPKADFTGNLVYAVAEGEDRWAVFLTREE